MSGGLALANYVRCGHLVVCLARPKHCRTSSSLACRTPSPQASATAASITGSTRQRSSQESQTAFRRRRRDRRLRPEGALLAETTKFPPPPGIGCHRKASGLCRRLKTLVTNLNHHRKSADPKLQAKVQEPVGPITRRRRAFCLLA
jgi:hypothetical protein